MPNFWFEDRSLEEYYMHGTKVVTHEVPESKWKKATTYVTNEIDWSVHVPMTRQDYEAQEAGAKFGQHVYRKGTMTTLQQVDRDICEFMGAPPPDDDLDSKYYMLCHELGFYSLVQLGGSYCDRIHVRWMQDRTRCVFMSEKDGISDIEYARRCAMFEWVFLKRWRYHATG